jgi:plasmid stabilization system protein ParE
MRIVVRAEAADDLGLIFDWIAKDNPRAAAETVARIRRRIGRLETPGLSHMGRRGRVEGTRELVEAPYIIVYEVDEVRGELTVLAVFHGAQDR